VPLNMDVEMPTLETIRRLVQKNEGVAFLPRMCVRQDIESGTVREVTVKELHVERKVRLLYAKGRTLSHAAQAFLDIVSDGDSYRSASLLPTTVRFRPTCTERGLPSTVTVVLPL